MTRRKVMIIFGTRPEAIKLFPVIRALREEAALDVRVCVTGQHRALLDQVLRVADIRPDIDLDLMAPEQTLDDLTARLLRGIGTVLDDERPARIIVQGDTASAMAASLSAYYRRIPIAHVEAGLRSGNLLHPWPEEGNRRIITGLAELHFAPTQAAANALLQEGVAPGLVHVTGNSGIDALLFMRGQIEAGLLKTPLADALRARFAGRRLLLVTCHRRESMGAGVAAIGEALRRLAERHDVAIILPVHPNPAIAEPLRSRLSDQANVALVEPLGYPDFVALLNDCHFVLTDSGGVQEEAPALGKPVLVMRETTERPEGVAAGTARLVGMEQDGIMAASSALLDDKAAYARMSLAHSPFGDGKAAERIAAIIADAMR